MLKPDSFRLALGLSAISATMILVACEGTSEAVRIEPIGPPPVTPKVAVVDEYHGERIPDPFRWLEDQDDPEVLAWADRQNEYTERFLSQAENRDALRERVTELWNFERWSAPSRHGPWWIWSKNDGLQDQAVLYRARMPDAAGEVLLDPNRLSADGTVALGPTAVSEDGASMAFATTTAGSDWLVWRVLDVATGRVLDDRLEWSKFAGAAWTHDGAGFFYQRFTPPGEGGVHEAQTRGAALVYHRVGTPQSEDVVVYERPDHPDWFYGATVTDDGAHLVIHVHEGAQPKNRIAIVDLREEGWPVRPLLFEADAHWSFVGVAGEDALFVTDLKAPNRRIAAVPLADPTAQREVVPESVHALEDAEIIGGEIVATYLEDARHVVRRFGLDGHAIGEIDLPQIGSIVEIDGRREDRVFHFVFTSFTDPGTVYAFDLDADELRVLRRPELPFDPAAFHVEQVGLQGLDGTFLKMFVVHRKGIALDRGNPVLLYGYGGFDVSLTPQFSVQTLVFCEMGGVYAQATLRGGGEYGKPWHEAGMLANKQNVFDDFVACARYFVRNEFTTPEQLAIHGRSNGGLLVGACMVQHPELFGAAIPEVGVLDMLRYHEFTIGWAWVPEYGSSADPEQFKVLRSYSPLHNVKPGVCYPPALIMTGDHDDRVLPGHSYKFAARLQEAQGCPNPVLLRVTRQAGHGSGKPTSLRIEETVDRLAFLGLTIGAK